VGAAIGDAAPLFRSLEFVPSRAAKERGAAGVTVLISADADNEGECEALVVDHRDPSANRKFRFSQGPHPVLLAELELNLRLDSIIDVAAQSAVVPVGPRSRPGMPPQLEEYLELARRHLFTEEGALNAHRMHLRMRGQESMSWPVRDGGDLVGEVRAEVDAEVLLQRVLSATRRDKGEIPFALDAGGDLLTANTADLETLKRFSLTDAVARGEALTTVAASWVVVLDKDRLSGVTFGIARPLGEPLAEIRQVAVRNLSYGVGMIGLALFGILPLSRRMTRRLSELSAGVERLAAGDLSARIVPSGRDEIGTLATSVNRMAAQLDENQKRLLEEERLRKEREMQQRFLEAEHARKSEELEQARQFQLSLLPQQLPDDPRYEVSVLTRTATEVGGDYYDFCATDDGALMVAIGDATGHGAYAGTMVTVVKSLFTALSAASSPASFLRSASNAIRRMNLGRMNMALSLARLDGRTMTVAAAGMPPILLRCEASGEVSEIGFEALPLGPMPEPVYEERQVHLQEGDLLLFMTDGFPEMANADDELIGYPRVSDIVETSGSCSPDELLATLDEAADDWLGGRALQDDFTFVAVRLR